MATHANTQVLFKKDRATHNWIKQECTGKTDNDRWINIRLALRQRIQKRPSYSSGKHKTQNNPSFPQTALPLTPEIKNLFRSHAGNIYEFYSSGNYQLCQMALTYVLSNIWLIASETLNLLASFLCEGPIWEKGFISFIWCSKGRFVLKMNNKTITTIFFL